MISNFTYLPAQFPEFIKSYIYTEKEKLKRQFGFESLSDADKKLALQNIKKLIQSGIEQRKEIVEKDPLKYYVPTGDNEQIISCLNDCRKAGNEIATISNFAGNATGKTESMVNIILNILIPQYNKYWFGKYDFFRNPRFTHPSIWYCSTSEALRKGEAVDNALHKYLDPIGYGDCIKYKSGNILASLKLPTSKFNVTFKTYGQDKIAFESGNVAFILYDEPPTTAIYSACKGRARGGLITLMNFTPLECPQVMLEDIEKGIQDKQQYVWKFTSSLWGTSISQGIRGFYTDKQINEIIRTYAAEEREARVSGKPLYYIGMVYKNLDKNKHWVEITEEDFVKYRKGEKLWYMPDKDAIFLYIEDPADARPNAGVWAAVNKNGRIINMMETPNYQGLPYYQLSNPVSHENHFINMQQVESELSDQLNIEGILPVKRRIIDRHFALQQRGAAGMTRMNTYREMMKDFNLSGKWVESYTSGQGTTEINFGHGVVRSNLDTYLPDGHPKLIIWSLCPHLWESMNNYSYRKKANDGIVMGNQLDETYKDFNDVERYLNCDKAVLRGAKKSSAPSKISRKKNWIKKVNYR